MLLLVNRRLGLRGLYLIFAFVFYFCYCKTSTFKYFPEHTEKNIYKILYIYLFIGLQLPSDDFSYRPVHFF